MTRRYSARGPQSLIIEKETVFSSSVPAEKKYSGSSDNIPAHIAEKKRLLYLETVFNNHKNDLKRYLLKLVRQEDVADDIIQDVFVRLIKYKNDIPESSMKGFLFVTSANLVKDRFRRQKVRFLSLRDPNYSAALTAVQENPETIAKHRQSLGLLKKALEDMDQKYHTAFILYRFHNKKHAEIATIMGVTSRSVQNYIREAMLQLNRKLQAGS